MKLPVFRTFALVLAIVGLMAAGAGVASAQTDVYQINYFANNLPAPVPDAKVRIDNPGLTYGNLCAMIYVFDSDQQMSECCGCVETHNGLRKLSVRSDLTGNPLTGVVSTSGVIKIVSAPFPIYGPGTFCEPSGPYTPTPDLRSWATHIEDFAASNTGAVWPITGNAFSDEPLGAAELSALQAQCMFIQILGSGHGICSCGTGD